MGDWQRDAQALQDQEGIVYLVAMTENCDGQPATAAELPDWQSELNFEAVLMTDPGRDVWSAYADANGCENSPPGGDGCSNAVTVLIDRQMQVRYFGATYNCGTGDGSQCGETATISDETAQCLQGTLDEVLALLAE